MKIKHLCLCQYAMPVTCTHFVSKAFMLKANKSIGYKNHSVLSYRRHGIIALNGTHLEKKAVEKQNIGKLYKM